ncbi:MAG: hypothetical protein K2N05_01820 [Muribaculaceae bacterium]|nr:hypothetical protein [Muribaculaceae bacterium]
MGKKKEESRHLFIKAEISDLKPYAGQAVLVSFNLYSKDSDIAYADRSTSLSLENKPHEFLSRLDSDSRGRRVLVDGTEYVVYPLEKYVVSFSEKANYNFSGDEFEVGVNQPVIYEDPFWGRRRGYKRENITVPVDEFGINVKARPKANEGENFSGAIGKYSIVTSIPPGDIILESPATAVIRVKGKGILDEKILPEYREAFEGGTVRLKSMSEKRKLYFDGKDVISELILNCEFVPLEMDAEIGEVTFSFFNPESGKIEKVVSNPTKVNVMSITSKFEPVEI